MRSSKVLLRLVESLLAESSFSNQVLYPYDPSLTLLKLPNYLYTKFILSQFTSYFPDFTPKTFPALSLQIYSDLLTMLEKNHRSDLITHLTPPLADLIKHSQKSNKPLPFDLLSKVNSSSIVHARISSDSEDNSLLVNFAHLTMRMEGTLSTGEPAVQFNTFERRLSNKLKDAWRICFIKS